MTQKHIGAARGAARAGASGDPKVTLQLSGSYICAESDDKVSLHFIQCTT